MDPDITKINIRDIWERIVSKIRELNAKNEFNPPATPEQLLKLESELGMDLPIAMAAFLGCQNGCVDYFDQLLVDYPFLSTAEIMSEWQTNCEADEDSDSDISDDNLSALWWHRRCLPVCGANGSCICIDLKTGQIYSFRSGMGGLNGPIAPTLVEWLADIAERLETGQTKLEDSKVTIELYG